MKEEKVILTLTTIPTRLNSPYGYDMRYTLQSLLNQKYNNFEIHLNIPFICKKTNEEYIFPEWLNEMVDNGKLEIFRVEDNGPITKLLPTLERITDPEQIIIVVDDDMIYNENMILEHIKNREQWPENPVGYDGIKSRNEDGSISVFFNDLRDHFYSGNHRNSAVDILQHYKSISYKRRFFEDDFFEFINQYYLWDDDISISAYFGTKKRNRIVTFYPDDEKCNSYEDSLNMVGKTFPIMGNTSHLSEEGCNLFRYNIDDNDNNIGINLRSQLNIMIDLGYVK
jgi:hypothetical protein